jgi:trehalose-6-phosphatase
VPHPRATAIFEIHRRLQEHEAEPLLTLYIGEDVPDDDAFEALGNDGISAAVGTRASKAQYRLTSTEEVWQLIARLAQTHSQS